MFKSHLMHWIMHFLEEWGCMDKWEAFLQLVPPYPELSVLNKQYSHVRQWQGKDIRQLIRYLLASLTPLLKPANEQKHSRTKVRVLLATRWLLEVESWPNKDIIQNPLWPPLTKPCLHFMTSRRYSCQLGLDRISISPRCIFCHI